MKIMRACVFVEEHSTRHTKGFWIAKAFNAHTMTVSFLLSREDNYDGSSGLVAPFEKC